MAKCVGSPLEGVRPDENEPETAVPDEPPPWRLFDEDPASVVRPKRLGRASTDGSLMTTGSHTGEMSDSLGHLRAASERHLSSASSHHRVIMDRLEGIFSRDGSDAEMLGELEHCSDSDRAATEPSWKTRSIANLSFKNPELFRGTSHCDVMSGFASVMGNQPCTSEYWFHSKPVDHIGTFISHNWSTPRHQKFLALALHFNVTASAIAGTLAAVAAFTLTVEEVLPLANVGSSKLYHQDDWMSTLLIRRSCWCLLSYVCVFLVFLFLFHELKLLCGRSGSTAFLDKYCVHQTDASLKKQGIESLAGFLFYSWDVLVLYTDIYLQKLWTVYEIASFLMLHPKGRVYICPLFLPQGVLAGFFMMGVSSFSSFVLSLDAVQDTWMTVKDELEWYGLAIILLFMLPPGLAVIWLLRRWAKEQVLFQDRVSHFQLESASCFSEDDRVVVQKNIVSFMKYFSLVESDAYDEEVYSKFENLVRKEVPGLLAASIGRMGITYDIVLVIMSPVLIGEVLDVLASLLLQEDLLSSPWQIVELVAVTVSRALFGIPLVIAVMLRMANASVAAERKGRAKAAAWICGIALLGLLAGATLGRTQDFLMSKRSHMDGKWELDRWFILQTATHLALAILTLVAYRPINRKKYRRTLNTTGELTI